MNREDRDQIERSYSDLNPNLAEKRERERKKNARRFDSLQDLVSRDIDKLLSEPHFIRWLFTEFERAGILDQSFRAQEALSQYATGWRAFGLAMLSDLESKDPGLMIRLMVERTKTLTVKDAPDEENPPEDDER